ncbi:hypothetical protein C3K47_17940 [Solitalea longa]|uniref:DUF4136 domain-containing protein n=1 Tax=Solitalea longa TaxID=2079460 RepID=A0A2S4ZX03_9SPHI|nr:hypothetical protein [Solitalea longa]POY34835.1 hypothetical protein C3K47_17940 [Solitalea longa]
MIKNYALKSVGTRCLALIISSAILFNSCSPATKVTATWKDKDAAPKAYKNLFIVALGQNLAYKKTIEDKMAAALTTTGAKATESTSVFPPDFTKDKNIDKEKLIQKFKEAGCDGIVSVALVNKDSETRYVPGTTYMPGPYYGNFYGYYGGMGAMYDPGYYTTDKTYYLETNLYDLTTEKLVWSGQSSTLNPTDIDKAATEFANIIVAKMSSDGVVSPIAKAK